MYFHLVFVSFPPLIGHTTLITLCGFAYGMPGFFIGATGSIVGSALAFVTLRLLFSKRLNAWSSQNEKWQALEAVVVTRRRLLELLSLTASTLEGEGSSFDHSHPDITLSSLGILQFPFCSMLNLDGSLVQLKSTCDSQFKL